MLFNNQEEWLAMVKHWRDDGCCFSHFANEPEKYPCHSVDWYWGEDEKWRSVFLYEGEVENYRNLQDKVPFGKITYHQRIVRKSLSPSSCYRLGIPSEQSIKKHWQKQKKKPRSN